MAGSQSDFATTSAPMPSGSPMVMPITGRSVKAGLGEPSAARVMRRF
jgi:hypothetical protein